MAEVILKGGTDKTVVHAVREELFQPFIAPNWTDLRVGFLLSITGALDDDDPTAVTAETIVPTSFFDRYWIGCMDLSRAMFIGYTNAGVGDTVLSSSDEGVGTTNANFWRPNNAASNISSGGIFSLSGGFQVKSTDGVQQHFAQDVVGAGGYAVLSMFRFRRDTPTSTRLTVTSKQDTLVHSGDVLFTDTPDEATLTDNLEAFPTTVQTWGPISLFHVPEAFFLYWPYRNSRLRIHAMGLLRAL